MSNKIIIEKKSPTKYEIINSYSKKQPLTFINKQNVQKLTFTSIDEGIYNFKCCIGIINYPPPHKPNIPYVYKVRKLQNRLELAFSDSNSDSSFVESDYPILYKEAVVLNLDSILEESIPVEHHILLAISKITIEFKDAVNDEFVDLNFNIQFEKNFKTKYLEQPGPNLVIDSQNNNHSYLRLDFDLKDPAPVDDDTFSFVVKKMKKKQLISVIISDPSKQYVSERFSGQTISNGHHSIFNFLLEEK